LGCETNVIDDTINITFNKLDHIYEKDIGGISEITVMVAGVNIVNTVNEIATGAMGGGGDKHIITNNNMDNLGLDKNGDIQTNEKGMDSQDNEVNEVMLQSANRRSETAVTAQEVDIGITTAFNPLSGVPLVELEKCEPASTEESNQNLT
jgi:hypothetical protein